MRDVVVSGITGEGSPRGTIASSTPWLDYEQLFLRLILVNLLGELLWGHLAGQNERQKLVEIVDDGPRELVVNPERIVRGPFEHLRGNGARLDAQIGSRDIFADGHHCLDLAVLKELVL